MNPIIQVDNLSKQYRLGQVGTGTIKDDLKRWWHSIRGKEDPFLTIGESNDRSQKGNSEYVWALKDINFEVMPGEVLGIIGRNGAGKSTLLKILSRVTEPSTGRIAMRGRVASLLEVGTGFHPDLTGRENIYLNGAILGMTKKEITRKFDEIVDFAGVERYIETPVKRYSSGMHVRLGFAVAAHLEPEILIVDEVLAVGDADFQKKCLGKMKDVSVKEGRTVLFVSHNMIAVESLCSNALIIEQGSIIHQSDAKNAVKTYLSNRAEESINVVFSDVASAPGNARLKLKKAAIEIKHPTIKSDLNVTLPFDLVFELWALEDLKHINLSLHLYNEAGESIFNIHTPVAEISTGIFKAKAEIPGNFLNDGFHTVTLLVVENESTPIGIFEDILKFEVKDFRTNMSWHGKWSGMIRPTFIPMYYC